MAGPRQILHAHLLLKNNLLHTGAGKAVLDKEATVHDLTGEGQWAAVYNRAAQVIDALFVHASS